MNQEERKIIEIIVWRTNIEVVKTMKKIPVGELFSWKKEKNGD